jgi:hypothetical protein
MTASAVKGQTVRQDVYSYSGVDWDSGMQWKPVVAGALAGFAVTLILTTLGAAIGITAGDAANGGDGRAVGIGALIWWALTVVASGLAGGWVIARTARSDMYYNPVIYGTLAWVLGAIILLFLLAIGVGSMMGGLGGGLGAAAAERGMPAMSGADTARVAERAADVGQGAAWGLLISQLVGLGSSIVGARRRQAHNRDAAVVRDRALATS